jgi:hypothetical protein
LPRQFGGDVVDAGIFGLLLADRGERKGSSQVRRGGKQAAQPQRYCWPGGLWAQICRACCQCCDICLVKRRLNWTF